MLETFYKYLGFQFAKFQFRNDIDQIQSFTEFLVRAKHVLIILPMGYDDAILASNAVRKYRDRLQHVHLTVIHSSTRHTSLVDFPKCEVIRIDPPDLNRFFLPTKPLLQRIFNREYDVAMDLNLDFVLHTAYICKASRAKVRVGFSRQTSDLFFNVQFNLGSHPSPQAMYEKFASCLSMF